MAASGDETHALRALLRAHFEGHAKGVEDAADAKNVFNEFARGTMAVLYDILREWGERHSALRRLPAEVIAHCFTFLPLRDRMTVARVSRSWRSIALSHPAIWSDISFSNDFPARADVLQTVLSRTGRLPIRLNSQNHPVWDPNGAIASCLAMYMDRVQSVNWTTISCLSLDLRAPVLETLIGRDPIQLSPDFLGGVRGSLRTLRLTTPWFPNICPAVSTVTHLTLSLDYHDDGAQSTAGLFTLFPALQFLCMRGMQVRFSTFLPQTSAPSSLVRVELETHDYAYDLTEHYVTWFTARLCDVSLHQACVPARLDRLLDGAEELVIDCQSVAGLRESYSYDIVARGPAERRSTLHFKDKRLAGRVWEVLCSLTTVRTLDLPSSLAYDLSDVVTTLPNLSLVTLRIATSHVWWPPAPRPDWNALNPLALALDCRADPLHKLVIRVGHDLPPDSRPSMQDARDLMRQLNDLSCRKISRILRVEGFPAEALWGLGALEFAGFRLEFATEQ